MKKGILIALSLGLLVGCGRRVTPNSTNGGVQALILSPSEDRLYVFNLLFHRVTAALTTGELPSDIAVSPDSSLIFVTNKQDNTISIFRRTDGNNIQSLGNIGTIDSPEKILFNDTFSEAYITFENESAVMILDIQSVWKQPTVKQFLRLPLDSLANTMALSSDGQQLFIADRRQAKIYQLNRQNNKWSLTSDKTLNTRARIGDLLLENNQLYISDQAQDKVHRFNIETEIIEESIALQEGDNEVLFPTKMAINPAKTKLYVVGTGNATVKVVNLANHRLLNTISLNSESLTANSFSPTGIDVTNDNKRVYVTDLVGRNISIISANADPEIKDKLLRNIGTTASAGFLKPLGEIKVLGSPNH